MSAQILPFPKPSPASASPLACFVRMGEAHKKLADLHAGGDLPARRVVVEASRFRFQKESVSLFRESGAEVVLDTQVAELAAPAKFKGQARFAPWALPDQLLGPDNFRSSELKNTVEKIGKFAVSCGVDVVLSPSHFLGDHTFDDWLSLDAAACRALRLALDEAGGDHIAIDYPVIVPSTMLNDTAARGEILAVLADLPIDNVWIRTSGFGSDAGPFMMKRYLASIAGFHNLGKPIVGDYLGGTAGMAALAFGALSGLGLGIGERERFEADAWHKLPAERTEDSSFGRTVRISVPTLQRSFTSKELDLLVSARGGRRICGCDDRSCCPHGYSDMVAEPRRHAAHQLFKAISALEAIPDLRRETYFLNGPMTDAYRAARQAKQLRPLGAEAEKLGINLDDLMKRLDKHSRRLERMKAVLERVHGERGDEGPRSAPIERKRSADNVPKRKDHP